MTNSGAPIAIAGAGIAGLSAAIALTLAEFPVVVLERDPEPRIFGAGLQLGPSATRRLQSLGVDVAGVANQPDAIYLGQARRGRILNRIPLGTAAQERFGAPYLTLLRADLHAALLRRADELNIPLYFNAPVMAVRQEVKALSVSGPQGAAFLTLALIGADGVYSTVRTLLPQAARAAYSHAIAWRGLIAAEQIPEAYRNAITVWMAAGCHLVHYPVARGQVYNAVLVMDHGAQIHGEGQENIAPAADLLRHVSGWAEEPSRLIAACPQWQAWPIMTVQQKQSGWGRIQLIGDAWHAMPPYLASGGVLAIEDADALAVCLRHHWPDMLTSLQTFRANRRSRLAATYRHSQRMGRIYHFPRPFDYIRDQAISALSGKLLLKRQDWLYSY